MLTTACGEYFFAQFTDEDTEAQGTTSLAEPKV